MMEFMHPEHLYYLLAIPVFALVYAFVRYLRKRKADKAGIQLPSEGKKFTITNGWFIFSVFALVYAIFMVGIASPVESEASSREYESKELQLMLAFDTSCKTDDGHCLVEEKREAVIRELDSLYVPFLDLNIGAISSSNFLTVHAPDRNFRHVQQFLKNDAELHADCDNFIAQVISECELNGHTESEKMKRAVIILTDRETIPKAEVDAAKKSAKAAAQRRIFTYVVGLGENVDTPALKEIVNAGKGVYINADEQDVTLESVVDVVKKNKRVTFIAVLNYFLLTIFYLVTPSIAIYLCKRYSWLNKIGVIIVLYAMGMFFGSVRINGASLFPNEIAAMQDILSTAMVPLAIPLMLYSCVLNTKEIGKYFKAMFTGLVGVIVAVTIGYLVCRDHIPEANKVAGMLTGVYTGGTINMAAIKASLQADNQTYILMQTYDIFVCLSYLIFLMVGGFKIFRKWLRFDATGLVKKNRRNSKLSAEEEAKRKQLEEELKIEEIGFRSIFTKEGFKNTLFLFGVTFLIIIVSAGLTLLISGGQLNMTIFFLLITTFAIMASYIKDVHNRKQHYNLGLYCIYIFSLVIATMADFESLKQALMTDFWLPTFMLLSVFGSLLITALLGKIFKVDADTMIITSVTYINSPAFVPMIAAAMRNRNVLIPGLTIGVVGFAVGNYLGTLMAFLLP